MTVEEKRRIYSNEFANGIVEINSLFEQFWQITDFTINRINDKYAAIYFPFSEVPVQILTEIGYAIIPKMYGLMDTNNLNAMGVNRVQNVPQLSLYGEGVLLGFVDTGIDYTNPVFKNADNSTRIVAIWDQTLQNDDAGENIFSYGTEFTREQINQALASENPLSVVPSTDEIGHGTMLAGVAGGSRDEENDFQGVATRAEFAVVKLKQAKPYLRDFFGIPADAVCYQQDDVMFGIKYLTQLASSLNRPIAICIGLGSNQGSHEGAGSLANFIGWEGDFVGRAFLVAAGNEGASRNHYFGTVDQARGYSTVELNVGVMDKQFTMELWGFAPNTYSIDITSPSGQYVPRIFARLGENRRVDFIFDGTVVYVDYLVIEAQTGSPFIFIRFVNAAPGLWKFNVYASGSSDLRFHIWLPIAAFISAETYFIDYNVDTTITSPGNYETAVTITAYDGISGNIYANASRGYTKNNNIKPDIAAPGVNVLVPQPGNQYIRASGTSIAAAHAAGVTAMLFEWGIIRGRYFYISSNQIQRFLIRGAVRNPNLTYPNNIWGYGTINIYNTFISLGTILE